MESKIKISSDGSDTKDDSEEEGDEQSFDEGLILDEVEFENLIERKLIVD